MVNLNELLKKIKNQLEIDFKENFTSLVLFGSYARGNENESSDLDLIITFKKLPTKKEDIQEFISDYFLSFEEKYHLTINCKVSRENKLSKTILIYEIADYAKIIVDKNKIISKLFKSVKRDYELGFVKKITRNNYHVIQFIENV